MNDSIFSPLFDNRTPKTIENMINNIITIMLVIMKQHIPMQYPKKFWILKMSLKINGEPITSNKNIIPIIKGKNNIYYYKL
jgi:hypothetical protein